MSQTGSHACYCLQEVENTLKGWFAEFHTYLNYDNPALAEKDPEKESPVDAVKAAVCQNINLFMEMNEEEFKDYLQTFVQDVWTLLTTVKQNVGQVQTLQTLNFYSLWSTLQLTCLLCLPVLLASWSALQPCSLVCVTLHKTSVAHCILDQICGL